MYVITYATKIVKKLIKRLIVADNKEIFRINRCTASINRIIVDYE